jgi:hypothetical protein
VILFAMLAIATMIVAAAAQEFPDVPRWYWAWAYIQGIRDAGISGGYDDGAYQPTIVVDRDQMAVFIARAMCEGDANVPAGPGAATFGDVPNTGYGTGGTDPYWAFKYIEYAVANHVVSGYEDGLYHPDWEVTRGQMAAFIARAMCGGDDAVPDPSGSPQFADVTDSVNSWCYKYVEYIAAQGVTVGYPDGLYHPEIPCTRDQMAAYLCRAFDLPMPPQPYNVTDYFPVTEGNSYTYETEEGVQTKTFSGTEVLHGRTFSRLVNQANGAVDEWLAQPDGLYFGGSHDPEGGVTSFDPAFRLPNGLDLGDLVDDQQSSVYSDATQVGTGVFHFAFVGVEDVTVPAGTFQNCMKLQLRFQVTDQPDRQFYVWVARGVGMVKLDSGDFGGTQWEVLISANVGGRHYPADGGPVRLTDYRPLDVGATLVYGGSDGTSIDQIVGVDRIGNIEAARLDRGPAAGTPAREYFALIDGALSLVGEYLPDSSTLLTFAPPISFPATPSIGDYGSSAVQVYEGDAPAGTATFDWAVVGAGPVSVAAGDFDNCPKLRIAFTDPSGGRYESYTWLAAGVGVVKEDARSFGDTYWRELTSARVLGVEFPLGDRLFDITDYVDLTGGNQWLYGPNPSGLPTIAGGIVARGGYDWTLVGNPSAIDAPFDYVRTDEAGLYWLGALGGAWANFEFDPPLLLSNGLAVGDDGAQTSSYLVNSTNEGDATLDYTFDGIEAVSTDAGLFPDCMKISYSLHLPYMSTGAAQAETVWYARGVGIVQRDNGSTVTQVTQATIGGVAYPPGDTTFAMTDYLPVAVDNQWAYMTQGEDGYRAATVIVDGIAILSGLPITDTVYMFSRYQANGYDGAELMAIRSDGIGLYGYDDPSSGLMVVNPPLVIPNGAMVGDSGELSSTFYLWATNHWEPGGAVEMFWQLADARPVTTSAGRFDDCVLVRWGASSPATGDTIEYCWYARGVGIVKRYQVDRGEWDELMGAAIGGQTIPADLAPATPVDASIPQGASIGFDFSAGAASALPGDQDLNYLYNSSQDALIHSFDTSGVSRYIGDGQYSFESIRPYATFLPPAWDLFGQAWMQEAWVLGVGWDTLENTAVVNTREGRYALVYIRAISASQLDMTYVYPYGFFGQ